MIGENGKFSEKPVRLCRNGQMPMSVSWKRTADKPAGQTQRNVSCCPVLKSSAFRALRLWHRYSDSRTPGFADPRPPVRGAVLLVVLPGADAARRPPPAPVHYLSGHAHVVY